MAVQVAPENVVGRDGLIRRIWKELESHSLRFTAERRIGKTTVMRKMLAEPRAGNALVFIDLEKVDSPERFTEVLLTEMKAWLSGTIPAARLARAILDILALATTPQTIDEVWAAMKARMALDNRDQVIQLLRLLAQDHYLTSDSEKRYVFCFPLIRQWWRLAQGIAS